MERCFVEALTDNMELLDSDLSLRCSTLWAHLVQVRAFTFKEADILQGSPIEERAKNKEASWLLEFVRCLRRKESAAFYAFLVALRNSGQSFIAEKLSQSLELRRAEEETEEEAFGSLGSLPSGDRRSRDSGLNTSHSTALIFDKSAVVEQELLKLNSTVHAGFGELETKVDRLMEQNDSLINELAKNKSEEQRLKTELAAERGKTAQQGQDMERLAAELGQVRMREDQVLKRLNEAQREMKEQRPRKDLLVGAFLDVDGRLRGVTVSEDRDHSISITSTLLSDSSGTMKRGQLRCTEALVRLGADEILHVGKTCCCWAKRSDGSFSQPLLWNDHQLSRFGHAAVALKEANKVLVTGGVDANLNDTATSVVLTLNGERRRTDLHRAQSVSPMPERRRFYCLVAYGTGAVAVGGCNGGQPSCPILLWDAGRDRWTEVKEKKPLPQLVGLRASWLSGRLFVTGGVRRGNNQPEKTVKAYDLRQSGCEEQQVSPMRRGRAAHMAFRLSDNELIVIGGEGMVNPTAERFDVRANRWEDLGEQEEVLGCSFLMVNPHCGFA